MHNTLAAVLSATLAAAPALTYGDEPDTGNTLQAWHAGAARVLAHCRDASFVEYLAER